MKIKKGDLVKIISGKDKGKQGKIIRSIPKEDKIVVEGLNLRIKHLKPRRQGEKGQRIQFPASLNVSKVMLICPKCSRPTRVGYKFLEDKSKERICKRCGEII